MTQSDGREISTFVVPVAGLSTPRKFTIGPITILPSTDDLPFLDSVNTIESFSNEIIRSAGTHRAVAVVESKSIDNALDIIEQALNVFRVFQYGLMRFAHYTHFGLPGEIHSGKIFYFQHGEIRNGPGFTSTGLQLGFELQNSGIDGWEQNARSLQFAVDAINNEDASAGAKRALTGIQYFSHSILQPNADLRVLLVVAGLEGMLKPDNEGSRSLILARKLTFLSCWKSGNCGHFDGQPCPYVLFNPVEDEDRGLLKKLARMSREDYRWKCTYWEMVNTWYETRSGVAHGRPEGVDSHEVANFAYWSYHQYIAPTLEWLINHPTSPVEDLDKEMAALNADRIDWRVAVKTGRMPEGPEEVGSETH